MGHHSRDDARRKLTPNTTPKTLNSRTQETGLYALLERKSCTDQSVPLGVATRISSEKDDGYGNQNVEGLTYADVHFTENQNRTQSDIIISTEEVTLYAEIHKKDS